MNTVAQQPMDRWQDIPWKKIEREVFKLQKRIYRAEQRGDQKQVRPTPKTALAFPVSQTVSRPQSHAR
jgi:RNA-directed DNA polymerase